MVMGCVPLERRISVPARNGYMIPGPEAAEAFRISPTDTLPEITPDKLPAGVRTTAAEHAPNVFSRPECTRFFSGETIYLALYTAFCGDELGKETDARPVAGFASDGKFLGSISAGAAEVVPFRRF